MLTTFYPAHEILGSSYKLEPAIEDEMTKKEIAAKNIGMTFDFIRSIVDNPRAVASIPEGAELDFIGADAPMGSAAGIKTKTARYKVCHVFEQVE